MQHTGAMKVTQLSKVDKAPMDHPEVKGVWKQVPIGVADGAPTFSMRVFTVEPGGHTPYHSHPWEHENYVLAGEGVLIDEEGATTPIRAGDFAIVLPDEKHQFRNTGSADLQFICLVPAERE